MSSSSDSPRFPEDLRPNPLARILASRRVADLPIADLTESNPTRIGIDYPAGLLSALADARGFRYEPDPRGLLSARRAIAQYYADRGTAVDPERIVLTASTSEAYSYLLKLLTRPGDAFLVPKPSYPLLDHLTALESVRAIPYPLALGDRWSIDLEGLDDAMREPRVRAVVVVDPNNPTGSVLTEAEWDAVLSLSRERGVPIIADEVFSDYVAPRSETASPIRSASSERSAGRAAFRMSGLSKVCGLPQLKLSWIVADCEDSLRDRLDLIADTYLSVNTPVQWAAEALLDARTGIQEQIHGRIRENLRAVGDRIRRPTTCRLLPYEAGWYAVLRAQTIRDEDAFVIRLLEEDGILVHPGYFYDFEESGVLVVSLLPPPAILDSAIDTLLRRIDAAP